MVSENQEIIEKVLKEQGYSKKEIKRFVEIGDVELFDVRDLRKVLKEKDKKFEKLIGEIDGDKLEEEHQKDSCGDPSECHYWTAVSDTKKELLKKLNCEPKEVQDR